MIFRFPLPPSCLTPAYASHRNGAAAQIRREREAQKADGEDAAQSHCEEDGGELKDPRPEGRGVKLTRWASRPVKSVRTQGLGHHAIGNAIPVRDRETAASSVSILGRIWHGFVCVARRRKKFS